jgi:Uncharacterized protein conserved in bacteria (DUF2188)
MGRLHVTPNGADSWMIRQERDGGIVAEYPTEAEAEAAAHEQQRGDGDIEIVVHDRFGRTRNADSNGSAA